MSEIELVTLGTRDLSRIQMFCGHSPTYRKGYNAKLAWIQARLEEGMRYRLLRVRGHNAGMVESIPGEYAWRGVEAKGYLFIHCFWVIGQNRGHGYGRQLLEACLEDARGSNGVALVVSRTHWLPTPKLFLKNGFELADQAPPSFDLLVKRFDPQAPLPRFRAALAVPPPGLVLYHSDQCPYMQNMPAIVRQAGEQLGLPVQVIRIENAAQAQASPCPYGVLGILLDGTLVDYRPTGTEKLIRLLEARLTAGE